MKASGIEFRGDTEVKTINIAPTLPALPASAAVAAAGVPVTLSAVVFAASCMRKHPWGVLWEMKEPDPHQAGKKRLLLLPIQLEKKGQQDFLCT